MNENEDVVMIPYVVYEQEKMYQQKTNLRWFIIVLVLIVSLIGSNIAWIIYESQFETVTETEETYEYEIDQENEDGKNNFIGRDGRIINGETKD